MHNKLPFDPDAERAVLGAVLINPDVLHDVVEILGPTADPFVDESCRAVYAAMLALHQDGRGIDEVTILNEVQRGDKLNRMFKKEAEATIGKKGTDYPDGLSVLTYFKGKYENNYFHVDDPKIDAQIARGLVPLSVRV